MVWYGAVTRRWHVPVRSPISRAFKGTSPCWRMCHGNSAEANPINIPLSEHCWTSWWAKWLPWRKCWTRTWTVQAKRDEDHFWLVVWLPFFIFPYIGFLIIPIDVHIFQRGGLTTNQIWLAWKTWLLLLWQPLPSHSPGTYAASHQLSSCSHAPGEAHREPDSCSIMCRVPLANRTVDFFHSSFVWFFTGMIVGKMASTWLVNPQKFWDMRAQETLVYIYNIIIYIYIVIMIIIIIMTMILTIIMITIIILIGIYYIYIWYINILYICL